MSTEERQLSHLDKAGKARMVDVSGKARVRRTAQATGRVSLQERTVALIRENLVEKGDVLAVARIAGIAAGKRATELIPLCHNIAIDHISVDFDVKKRKIDICATAVCTDKTGIEMEVLTAVSVAALTIYDMCKAVDKTMTIGDIRLQGKSKGPLRE